MPDTAAPGRESVYSVCPHDCPSTCALQVERIDRHTIGRVRGWDGNDYTAGVVCAKVGRYAERVHHPERLAQPLRRVGDKGVGRSAFAPIAWEDALAEVAEQLARAAQRHGPEAVWPYFYAGTMGLVQRDGIERLTNVMRWSRFNSTICVTLSDTGWLAGVGRLHGSDAREIGEASELVVVWGGNPVSTQVNLMTHITRARKARGAKLVVVDPYRTPTAEMADMHLMLRPGTDAALACAVMHVMFEEGLADRAYLARYTDAPEELERHLATRDPAWAAAITGLAAEEIVAFARLYGATKRSYIRVGYGFSRARNGAASVHAVTCLPAVTGAWAVRGGGALYSNRALYALDDTLIKGRDALDPGVRALDQSRIGPILLGDERDLGDGPPVTALLIQNTNPMMVCPEHDKVRAGFARADLFTCVHEQFMTETAAMADIVLPATTFLEHDDIYRASAHTVFQVARKVIEPYAEARENHVVICALAKRLGAAHRGFGMTAWEIIDESLRLSGYPDAATMHATGGHDCALPFERAHFLDGFGFPDGRFRFKPDWASLGADGARMPALPDQIGFDAATEDRPFRLVAPPARSFLNSTFSETPSSRAREGRPTVLIHPADCAALGLAEGDLARLGNARGAVAIHARPFDGVQRGVVVVEGIWPNAAFVEGRGINTLTSAEPGWPKGGAVFHDTAVWVRRA
jgi:anaerobic selenocysteine-containing dehydrogenase